jgi:predicted RND superfamily exporter protein
MAEMGPRSVTNIVFVILLALGLAAAVWFTLRFISAASGGPY